MKRKLIAATLVLLGTQANAQPSDDTLVVLRNRSFLVLSLSIPEIVKPELKVTASAIPTTSSPYLTQIRIVGGMPKANVSQLPVLAKCDIPPPEKLLDSEGNPLLDDKGGFLTTQNTLCIYMWPVTSMVSGNNQIGMVAKLSNGIEYQATSYVGKPTQ